jgi:aspartate aminotransferase
MKDPIAALANLLGTKGWLSGADTEPYRQDWLKRHGITPVGVARPNLVVDGIRQINGLTLSPPEGTFYAYIGCASLIDRKTPKEAVLEDDAAVATYLLNEGRVASMSGVAYGLSPYFRTSSATGAEVLSEAIRRIKAAVAEVE